tara:strand:- start:1340 stop:1546 length:207 start_codon:yes stop_codon:yes gene_type:complete
MITLLFLTKWLLTYLAIGWIIMILITLSCPIHFDENERLIMIISWPYMLVKFIQGFIKSLFENREEDE